MLKEASSLVRYSPESGLFESINGHKVIVPHHKGYLRIKHGAIDVLAHRLAWFMHYGKQPPPIIDHKNRIKSDNRIENLRAATDSENKCNRNKQKNNKSGHPGVHFIAQKCKWVAYIKKNSKRKHLGAFDSMEEALEVRQLAEVMVFGDFAPNG